MALRTAPDLGHLAAGVRLTPAQRRVLHALARHADEVPYLSATDLAARAGVSQPSVTRLAHVLGFDGYAALREALRTGPAGGRSGHAAGDRATAAAGQEIDNLHRLRDGLAPPATWAAMGAALAGSVPLVVVGLRASRYLAGYLSYLARKVHPDVVEVGAGGPDARDTVSSACDAGATTAVVVCMPRYPRQTVELLGDLDRLGLRTVLVTDDLMPLVPQVTPGWRLPVPVGSGLTFDGHPAAVVVLALLVEALCNATPGPTAARLERLDRVAEEAGTYWEP